ncbi:hypothetical protein A9W98_24760 [Mycobacterium gordonae]|uniref:Uncharacterized protein n=1 Tax=Mycobacterium gordonae TaxID=1778 RepID=A0A1A6BDX3_MYCGO|nr:hypothetical protein A9W98_24760 [Mycobacterium gordonae]
MFVEDGVVGVDGVAEDEDTGVVDQDVHRARFGGQPPHRAGIVELGGDESCLAAATFDLKHHFSAALRIAPVHHHVGATLRELKGDGAADPRRGAGDQGRVAAERRHARQSRGGVSATEASAV